MGVVQNFGGLVAARFMLGLAEGAACFLMNALGAALTIVLHLPRRFMMNATSSFSTILSVQLAKYRWLVPRPELCAYDMVYT